MTMDLLFINCSYYNFVDDNGKKLSGYSVKAYDPNTKQILKVKSDKDIDMNFGDVITVNVSISGNRVKYVA